MCDGPEAVLSYDQIVEVMGKHVETESPIPFIPKESYDAYDSELQKAAREIKVSFEYQEIEVDIHMEAVLRKITGQDNLALEFMMKEASRLEIPKAGILQ